MYYTAYVHVTCSAQTISIHGNYKSGNFNVSSKAHRDFFKYAERYEEKFYDVRIFAYILVPFVPLQLNKI
jgi:hypothetical protein